MTSLTKDGGWVSLAFAVPSWYHSAGDVTAATFDRRGLPLGSLHRCAQRFTLETSHGCVMGDEARSNRMVFDRMVLMASIW